jgi:excisionase family DNA binding protein
LDTLLSVEQAAERLGTSLRFVRRLVFERRIAYVKLGRHVRIATHAGSGPKPSAPTPELDPLPPEDLVEHHRRPVIEPLSGGGAMANVPAAGSRAGRRRASERSP